MANILTSLLKPHDEIEQHLNNQIKIGREIATINYIIDEDYTNLKARYNVWNDFNEDFLNSAFSTQSQLQKYDRYIISPDYGIMAKPIDNWFKPTIKCLNEKINFIEGLVARLRLFKSKKVENSSKIKSKKGDYSKVFIVHGHDNEAKIEVARFIEKLEFEAIILHEQPNNGRTIIEKIEDHSDVNFAIIIYTACDVGASLEHQNNLRNRARQNVVFEHGFFLGALGRKNICQLVKGDIETPGDISGIVYTEMKGGWEYSVAKEMRKSGYNTDLNKL